MNSVVKRLHQMNDDELLGLSEAIDTELDRRMEMTESIPDSARRRANSRQQSYRRSTGSTAPPIRAIGLRNVQRPRAA